MYNGPGMYRHYKGGHYLVLGLGRHESEGTTMVVYVSMDSVYQSKRMEIGETFVLRPLNNDDVDNADREGRAFNEPVRVGSESQTPRFQKVA